MPLPVSPARSSPRRVGALFGTRTLLPALFVLAAALSSATQALAQNEQVLATIPTGAGTIPWDVAVNPNTNRIYVAEAGTNSVVVIDGATNTVVATIPTGGGDVRGVAVNPNTNRVYATDVFPGKNSVYVIDGATNAVVKTITVGGQPIWKPAVNTLTNRIYVANNGGNSVSVIDGTTDTVIDTITGLSSPQGLGINPATNRLYVPKFTSSIPGTVSIVDLTTDTILPTTVTVGKGARNADVNTTTNLIYVANEVSNTVTVIDGATNSTTTITGLSAPWMARANPNFNRIYVTNQTAGTVSIIDGATNAIVKSLPVPGNARGVAVNTATNRVYVANSGGSVSVIGTPTVMISEFRFRGPNGVRDEFVELYNGTGADLTVSTGDNSAGWALVSSDAPAAAKYVVPNGTVIPARGHFLVTNAGTGAGDGYSLGLYAAPDLSGAATYTGDIPDTGGVALYSTADSSSFNDSTRLDAAGCAGAPAGFFETTPLQPVTDSQQFSYTRRLNTGRPQDTDNNRNDFLLVATRPDLVLSATANQGAPGPENTASPVNRGDRIKSHLVDATQGSSAPPNRVRNTSSYMDTLTPSDPTGTAPGVATYPAGTLAIRRRFTNNTGATITGLRFRVVDITANGTNTPNADGTADVRAISSPDVSVSSSDPTVCGGATPCSLTARGLQVDQQGPMPQTRGGGFNTSLSIDLSGNSIPPGGTIDLQFLLGVNQTGNFRFFVTVEALPGVNNTAADLGGPPAPASLNGGKRGRATTPKGGLSKGAFVKGRR